LKLMNEIDGSCGMCSFHGFSEGRILLVNYWTRQHHDILAQSIHLRIQKLPTAVLADDHLIAYTQYVCVSI
jgi:hypothetical protein